MHRCFCLVDQRHSHLNKPWVMWIPGTPLHHTSWCYWGVLSLLTVTLSRYILIVILYWTSFKSSMWHFYIMIYLKLNFGKQKSTLTLSVVIKFLDWILQYVGTSGLYISFLLILKWTIIYLHPLSNKIRALL